MSATVGSAVGEKASGRINTIGLAGTGNPKAIEARVSYRNSVDASAVTRWTDGDCDAPMTTAFDTVRLGWSAGDFEASGKIYMYGLSRT